MSMRGKPVVVSVEEYQRLRGEHRGFGALYRKFLKKYPSKEFGVDSKLWKGIRDRSAGRPVKL